MLVMRLKPVYRAETLILVESQKIPEKYVSSTVIGDIQDRLATINQEILSATRLKKVIVDYKLYPNDRVKNAPEEVVELMRHDVEVKLEKGWSNNRPGAFRISYEGPIPTVVASVVNRLANLYIDENLKVREVQAEGTLQFLETQQNDAKKKLDDLESAVSQYKVEHNGELPQQENTMNATLMRLQTELQGTQDAITRAQQNKVMYGAELTTLDNRLSALLSPSPASVPGERAAFSSIVSSDGQAAAQPVKASKALSEHLKELMARYSNDYPDVKRTRAALAEALRNEQQDEASVTVQAAATAAAQLPKASNFVSLPPSPAHVVLSADAAREVEQLRQRVNSLKAQQEIADRDIEGNKARRENVLKEMTGYQTDLKKLPIREQEMAALTRDYEIAKLNYRSLLDKKISAEMAAEMERRQKAERFMVLDPAQVPEKPSKPNRSLLISVASLFGLAIGAAVAFAKEWNKDLLLGEWELPPDTIILGRIPNIEIVPDERSRGKLPAVTLASTTPMVVAVLVAACRLLRGLA